LIGRQFGRTSAFPVRFQTGHTCDHQLLEPLIHTRWRYPQYPGDLTHFFPSTEAYQGRNASHQFHITSFVRPVQSFDQLIDGFFADEYSRVEHRWPPELFFDSFQYASDVSFFQSFF
jgi:hypothetical protein